MEGSVNRSSLMNRPSSVSDEEESGWTAYFEDFSDQRRADDDGGGDGTDVEDSFCSSFATSSMVSDAASIPAWNKSISPSRIYDNNNHVSMAVACSSIGPVGSPNFPRKLTFKKTRAKEISHDDSLEDTASSPVNSPKISDFDLADMNTAARRNCHFSSSLGKGESLDQYGGVMETNQRCEMSCSGNNNNCPSADLKKRGLCLVPLSMLVNYLG